MSVLSLRAAAGGADDDGRSGPRLRVLAGIPPEWYDATLAIERAPSLAGPVSLHLEQQARIIDEALRLSQREMKQKKSA